MKTYESAAMHVPVPANAFKGTVLGHAAPVVPISNTPSEFYRSRSVSDALGIHTRGLPLTK